MGSGTVLGVDETNTIPKAVECMTIGSLFAGIGGLELGLERAGLGPTIWQAEQDPYCLRVLAKHWPGARRYDDVRSINAEAERPDIICGGFPCQDISAAGKGAGLAGQRSGLWREYARIVRELRPRFVVVENVSALLGRGLGDVLGDLAACGYDAEWDCIPAAAVGAPHRRDRVFVVAWRVSDPECDGVREQSERGQGAAQAPDGGDAESEHLGARLADAERSRLQGAARTGLHGPRGTSEQSASGHPQLANGNGNGCQGQRGGKVQHGIGETLGDDVDGCDMPQWPPAPDDMHAWGRVQADSQPAVCRVAHGIPDRAHRLRALGNAVVPQVAELVGRRIVELMRATP